VDVLHFTGNLRNVEDKHADQPDEKRATPYRIHVLLLFNSKYLETGHFQQEAQPTYNVTVRCVRATIVVVEQLI
jgi:hypothetical protein